MIDNTRQRCFIGWLAMILPIGVLILSLVFGFGFPDSISWTYYLEPCITPFMIILGAASIFLICYKGYDKSDDIICSITGISGLLICLFPCRNSLEANGLVGTFQIPHEVSGWIHNISAVAFFILLAYISLFMFTKTDGNITLNKKKRNIIFRICGIGMIASFVAIVPANILNWFGVTWIVEAIALAFFGISWLTKANYFRWLFADPKPKK